MAEFTDQNQLPTASPFFQRRRPAAKITVHKFIPPNRANTIRDPWAGSYTTPQPQTQPQKSDDNPLVQRNSLILTNIAKTMKTISDQMVNVNKALVATSTLIVDSEKFRQEREEDDAKRQEHLRNLKLATNAEQDVEKEESGFRRAIMAPIRHMGRQVQGFLGKIQNAIMILLAGWIGTEFLNMIKAWQQNNQKLMSQIKSRIALGIFSVSAVLGGIKWAFGKIAKTIIGLGTMATSFVGRNVLSKPLGAILSAVTGGRFGKALMYGAPFRRLPQFGRKPFIPPSRLRNPGLFLNARGMARWKPGLGTGLSVAFDVFNKDYLDAFLGGSALALARVPNPYAWKAAAILGIVYWSKQFLELIPGFGGGVNQDVGNDISVTRDSNNQPMLDIGAKKEILEWKPEAKWHHGLPFFINPTALMSVFGFDPWAGERPQYQYWVDLDPDTGNPVGITTEQLLKYPHLRGIGNRLDKKNWIDVDSLTSRLEPVEESETIAVPLSTKDNESDTTTSSVIQGKQEDIPVISSSKQNIYASFAYAQTNMVGVA